MKYAKLLLPVAVPLLAAACSDVGPTSPTPAMSAETMTAPGDAQALSGVTGCRTMTGVKVHFTPSSALPMRLKATYSWGATPGPHTCSIAPVWSSRPAGRLKPTKDSFVVAVRAGSPLTVTATAPNGVHGSLSLPLPPTR
jgi:hypothetical protein